jgi:PadR family transcriptional regulator, regulatory protein PadR
MNAKRRPFLNGESSLPSSEPKKDQPLGQDSLRALQREILLSFWKIHILHHAAEGPVVGQWMLKELRHHGYDISPGTLYPILHRMEALGWLRSESEPGGSSKVRRLFFLTDTGGQILDLVRNQVAELSWELAPDQTHTPR